MTVQRRGVPLVPDYLRIPLFIVLFTACQATADVFSNGVRDLGLTELVPLTDTALVGSDVKGLPESERRAAAVLIEAGVIERNDLTDESLAASKISDFISITRSNHPGLIGRIGDPSVFVRLARPLDHSDLLSDDEFIKALHQALGEGILTGYDLRSRAIYDNFPAGRHFVYSHSSLNHIQQLVTLAHREEIDGWLYLVPKVSAFLFRDDWGEPGESVVALPDGRLVVQGREMAVLFLFDEAEGLSRFHELVTKFAKKDEADEQGLIANSWWQPFYYSDVQRKGFEEISLVILSKGDYEATLTVLTERTDDVVTALTRDSWELRVDQVWVNPPFFRFLNGGFK